MTHTSFLKFVTDDENYIYVHDPELKQKSSKWNCPSTPAEESTASKM
jgi:anaerobic ribonucleoside-triphosphate reductase